MLHSLLARVEENIGHSWHTHLFVEGNRVWHGGQHQRHAGAEFGMNRL